MQSSSKPNYAIPAIVFALFAVGLSFALTNGGYHDQPHNPGPAAADPHLTALFDGKSLGKWKRTEFGGEGEVEVENGEIMVHAGSTLSGVNWTGAAIPTVDYEIELDAKKVSG